MCCDIKSLVPINEISHKAGDLAILESMKRMSDAAGEDDYVFRIGGDEFALLTASTDAAYAKQIADKRYHLIIVPMLERFIQRHIVLVDQNDHFFIHFYPEIPEKL